MGIFFLRLLLATRVQNLLYYLKSLKRLFAWFICYTRIFAMSRSCGCALTVHPHRWLMFRLLMERNASPWHTVPLLTVSFIIHKSSPETSTRELGQHDRGIPKEEAILLGLRIFGAYHPGGVGGTFRWWSRVHYISEVHLSSFTGSGLHSLQ